MSGLCKGIRWCAGTDMKWVKKAVDRKNKLERKEYIARKEIERYREAMDRLKEETKVVSVDEVEGDKHDDTVPENSDDHEYQPAKTAYRKSSIVDNLSTSDAKTRLSLQKQSEVTAEEEASRFPDLPIRTGLKTFDMTIIETLVIMEAKFKVDARKARELLAYIGNTIFHQKWTVAEETKDKSTEVDIEDVDTDDNAPKKKRRKLSNLTFQLPDRSTVAAYLSDFALLSFTDMAERMVEAKKENKSITYGVDDTVKAAGFRRHDVKNMHITILDEKKNRETYTSGFYPNASHTGKDAAETVKHDIAKMAVLVDFFMTDRNGSSDVMLDELDASPSRSLKCNAHVAIDKVFRNVEGIVGVANLVGRGLNKYSVLPKTVYGF